jgi:hypothetical protein
VPYEDYLRIKVVTLGTSIQVPMVTGAKGHLIVPFDASKTIADISFKVKGTLNRSCACPFGPSADNMTHTYTHSPIPGDGGDEVRMGSVYCAH